MGSIRKPPDDCRQCPEKPPHVDHSRDNVFKNMSNEPAIETRRSRLATYNQVALALAATVALCYYGRLVLFPILLGVTVALVLAPAVDRLARWRVPRPLSALVLLTVTLSVMYAVTHLLYNLVVQFLDELPAHSSQMTQYSAHTPFSDR